MTAKNNTIGNIKNTILVEKKQMEYSPKIKKNLYML